MIPVSLAFHASMFWLGWHNSARAGYFASLFQDVLSTVLFLPFLASIAVAWHRRLLMNEEWPGSVYLRFDGLVAGYLGLSAVISILFPGPMIAIPSGVESVWQGLLLLVVALATGAGLFLGTRIWLALPARALGNSEIAVRQAWRDSRGNVWRLIAGSFLCSLPMVVLVVLAAMFGPDLAEASQALVYAAWQTLFEIGITFLAAMPIVSFLSLAYRRLIQDRPLPASRLQASESTP
jgi:ABC-type spermidine/putrescine transport system permease subunit II